LRWLAMTCAHFGRDQICTQIDASFSPFGHSTQVIASWETSINLLLANEIRIFLTWHVFYSDLGVLARKVASPFSHPTQLSTQVQLPAACEYLRVHLASASDPFCSRTWLKGEPARGLSGIPPWGHAVVLATFQASSYLTDGIFSKPAQFLLLSLNYLIYFESSFIGLLLKCYFENCFDWKAIFYMG